MEQYFREAARRRWLASTGQAAPEPSPVPDAVRSGELVHRALAEGDRGLARELTVWFFRERLAAATRDWRTAQRTTTDGDGRSQSQLVALTRRTTGVEREHAAAALRDVTQRLRSARRRWLDEHAAARHDLGFATHGALVRALHPEVDEWVARATAWLDGSREEYLAEWRGWREAGARIADTRLVASGVHAPPTAAGPLSAVMATLAAWGFAAEAGRVAVDLEPRPGKAGFAFCTAVDPPRDVRVSAVDSTAVNGYATLLHEFGHALHFTAGVRDAPQLWRASPALSEAFGFALELVVREPAWQRQRFGAELTGDDVARVRFARESVRRTVAASLVVEMAIHDGHHDPETLFAQRFAAEFDADVDGASAYDRLQTYLEAQPCYPLLYVQAFTLRDALWQQLADVGGVEWFTGPQARPAVEALLPRLNEPGVRLPEPAPPAPR